MSDRIVYFNGKYVPEAEARISIYDSALTLGDMAFEVTRTIRHVPYRLRAHLDRLYHTLSVLAIDPRLSPSQLEDLTLVTLARNLQSEDPDVDWMVIHHISRGPARAYHKAFRSDEQRPTVVISCYPLTEKMAELAVAYDQGLELVVPRQRSIPGEILDPSLKTRSRVHLQLANLQAAQARSGATPLLLDADGHLTETTTGNVFVVADGRLLTPPTTNLLPGITRDMLLELARNLKITCHETPIELPTALRADEVFVTSTSIGVLHARSVDGQTIANGKPGPVTKRLRAALHQELGLDLAEQAKSYQLKAERLLASGPQGSSE